MASADPGQPTPFATALTAAIDARGASLQSLAQRLSERGAPLSIATLSYWRSGQRRPERGASLDALRELEDLLRVEPGHLVRLVVPPQRPGPDRTVPFEDQLGLAQQPSWLDDVFPDVARDHLVTDGGDLLVEIGEDGRARANTNRMHWKSRADGARQAISWLAFDPGMDPPEVRAVRGCSVGRQQHDRARGLLVVELLLDRPLRLGERTVTEHQVLGVTDREPTVEYLLVAERRNPEAMVWVSFHPSRLPSRIWRVTCPDGAEPVEEPVELVGTTAHHMVHRFGPGRLGLRWAW